MSATARKNGSKTKSTRKTTPKAISTPTIEVVKIKDLVLDDKNANKGTERGLRALDDSLKQDGAGRSVLLDKNRRAIAGNKTIERAADQGYEEVIIVKTNGKQVVAVQRDDVDLDSEQGRRMAIRDNRVSELDLAWDPKVLADMAQDYGVGLNPLWSDAEFKLLLSTVDGGESKTENYTRKIDIPIYEPTQDKPAVSELIDRSRADTLIAEIKATKGLPEDARDFLIAAASRHVVFNYARIADWYAHSPAKVQRLIENSALVIVDLDRAIELGYAKLTQSIADIISSEDEDDD